MNYGLYGQIFAWILEILPYLEENNLWPYWEISAAAYGPIFGHHLRYNYEPFKTDKVVTLSALKQEHSRHFGDNFGEANRIWQKYFFFSKEIIAEVTNILERAANHNILGLHFRGTDKIGTEGGEITIQVFLRLVDDFLKTHPAESIYVCTDERSILKAILNHLGSRHQILYDKDLLFGQRENLLFSNLEADHLSQEQHYKQCLVDVLTLSKCKYVLKTASQYSAWAKIFNPSLEIFRVSAFIHDWFPDSRIPTYEPYQPELKPVMKKLLLGDWQSPSTFGYRYKNAFRRAINFGKKLIGFRHFTSRTKHSR